MISRYLIMGILLVCTGGLFGCINSNTVIIIQEEKVDAKVLCLQNGLSDPGDDNDPGCPDSGFERARSKPAAPARRTGGHPISYRPPAMLTEASYFRR